MNDICVSWRMNLIWRCLIYVCWIKVSHSFHDLIKEFGPRHITDIQLTLKMTISVLSLLLCWAILMKSLIMVWMRWTASSTLNQWIVFKLFQKSCFAIWPKSHIQLTLKMTISVKSLLLSYIYSAFPMSTWGWLGLHASLATAGCIALKLGGTSYNMPLIDCLQ